MTSMATETITQLSESPLTSPRHVTATLNYYRDPGDGSPPTPVLVGGYILLNILHPINNCLVTDKHVTQKYRHQ